MRRRQMNPLWHRGPCCTCLDCTAAGVTDLPSVRVPPDQFCSTRRWLHGEELRAWYAARDRAWRDMRGPTMHAEIPTPERERKPNGEDEHSDDRREHDGEPPPAPREEPLEDDEPLDARR